MNIMSKKSQDLGMMIDENSSLRNYIESWRKPVTPKREDHHNYFLINQCELWIEPFISSNSHLSSSAKVERMLSTSGNILTSKRNRLKKKNISQMNCSFV